MSQDSILNQVMSQGRLTWPNLFGNNSLKSYHNVMLSVRSASILRIASTLSLSQN